MCLIFSAVFCISHNAVIYFLLVELRYIMQSTEVFGPMSADEELTN